MMDALSTRIKAITRLVTQLTAKWVEIGTTLQNEMQRLGDVNQDGEITQADGEAVMNILSGELTETPIRFVLGDLDFDGKLSYYDAMTIADIISGQSSTAFIYATAVEYAGAAVGDYVRAVFTVSTSSGMANVPIYAYVPKAGIIGIYSNVKIPAHSTGEIRLLKA